MIRLFGIVHYYKDITNTLYIYYTYAYLKQVYQYTFIDTLILNSNNYTELANESININPIKSKSPIFP